MSSFSKLYIVQEKILENIKIRLLADTLVIAYLRYITWTTNEQYQIQ